MVPRHALDRYRRPGCVNKMTSKLFCRGIGGIAQSSHTHAHPPADESIDVEPEGAIVSKIFVDGICCPSEIPIISNLLSPMRGVIRVGA